MNCKDKYIGLEGKNNKGQQMKIVDYVNYENITIQFSDGTVVKGSVGNFKKGMVKNPNAPEVLGIGIIGDKYSIRDTEGKIIKEYITWRLILERCYSEKSHQRDKSKVYSGCSVCKEWFYFPNFYDWLHSQGNYDKWKCGGFSIDKDIILKHNKLYCPQYCCLVPAYINNAFTKHDSARGKYPIGVIKNQYGTYDARVNYYGKSIHLYGYSTPEEAFYAYKERKESIIKEYAEREYKKGNITAECYNAMIQYKVEITD